MEARTLQHELEIRRRLVDPEASALDPNLALLFDLIHYLEGQLLAVTVQVAGVSRRQTEHERDHHELPRSAT